MSLNCWARRESTLRKGENSVPMADTSYITTAVSSSITMCGRVSPAQQLLYRQVTPYLKVTKCLYQVDPYLLNMRAFLYLTYLDSNIWTKFSGTALEHTIVTLNCVILIAEIKIKLKFIKDS